MGIGFSENAPAQQLSIVLSEGMGSFLPQESIAPKDKRKEAGSAPYKLAGEMSADELMEKSRGSNMAREVLRPFLSKLAQAGITFDVQGKGGQENERDSSVESEDGDSFKDSVELSSDDDALSLPGVGRVKKDGMGGGSGGGDSSSSGNEVDALLEEYEETFSQYARSKNPSLLTKVKELREKLLEQGVKEQQLVKLEAEVRSGTKFEKYVEVMKSAFLQEFMAQGKIGKIISRRGLQETADMIEGKIGKEATKEAAARALGMAKEELGSFALEELENALVRKTHLQDGSDPKEIKTLLKLVNRAGIDPLEWINVTWTDKKGDHGLNFFDVPPSVVGVVVDTEAGNPDSQQKRKHGFEYSGEDEKEIILNRLRALYMQQAIRGDQFTRLETDFKIRKLKNGLFKLGIFTEDLDDRIKNEAQELAKLKTLEMLEEALVERATFYELSGASYDVVERKIKGLVKNAERLGMPLEAQEFNLMRDKANRRVFDISLSELEELKVQRGAKDSPGLEQKEGLLVRLLTRLKEESEIETIIPVNC